MPNDHDTDPEFLGFAMKMITRKVQTDHISLAAAADSVKSRMRADIVDEALKQLEEKRRRASNYRHTVVDRRFYNDEGWYLGPTDDGQWSRYLNILRGEGTPGLDSLDEETSRITGLLANPSHPGTKRKGLVMGNVQSGKTRNFAGVIAKAVDAGYRFVIVLSGMYNNLREQTQARLTEQVFSGSDWYSLTQGISDLGHVTNAQQVVEHQMFVCAVVKKNTARLANLTRMLKEVPDELLKLRPVLIIDDEADQATPNSMAQREKISAINRRMREVWAQVETGSYVGYSATPFANVLIDPDKDEDLFPSDFITTLTTGPAYFGARRVFGLADTVDDNGETEPSLDMVRLIPATEAETLQPPSDPQSRDFFDPPLPDSLKEALAWFIVATAIRRARGQMGHSSMLIHTTHYTAPHVTMRRRVTSHARELQDRARQRDMTVFKRSWDTEARRATGETTMPLPTWDEVQSRIPAVLAELEVIVDNGESNDRLDYDPSNGSDRTIVVIGGGTLARGLTLEGLVVSYFTRTSSTYDTLMQMGRWFGYRNGYEDLPRVWVTEGLDQDYAFLARVEADLRDEIESVQDSDFTPRQLGVRIRTHPGRLQITAENKMYNAEVVQIGLSDTANQVTILDGRNPAISHGNLNAVRTLVSGLRPQQLHTNHFLIQDVNGERIITFLRDFKAHPDQKWLSNEAKQKNLDNMVEWIHRFAGGNIWNVVLVSNYRQTAPDGVTPLGSLTIGSTKLGCLNRSVLRGSTSGRLDFKAVMSPGDRICDIPPSKYGDSPRATDADRRRIRRSYGDGRGLVVIYPISSHSQAAPASRERMNIPTELDQVAFSIFMPSIMDADGEDGTFVSVRRPWDVPELSEDEELPEEESANE
ncbi:Endonuclease [Propionibacterium freudenreichii]|uniref:Z1 domain-containing protein n=1 Tax=Propionibacterium freudenreichii TaxID=1744 RepID=UPI0005A5CEA1|nr:Z1 domain-containing protein [Propionibacterium freudenreichii]MDK9676332.1 Z1 domain-containing protein [Propionibacterium freudenreichii]CEI46641.1 Endonuclease [Propionibacterium freudenreichii]SCQ47122.1 Endonuclease, Z1 domain-containing protein [Propionibacterium freudenreichii]SCQ54938.1 Endonuclease, Z1 domain-containing protein [Propionibacterium freudenreichii]